MIGCTIKRGIYYKINLKNQLKIYLTDEEKEIFEKKMKLANCKTMSHFLRKCVLEKEIYIVDLEPFRDIQ
ncbi:plasmid mobilization protein [Campylobacter ureolyticus]|uniref:plasmid mobilization protein n=1 Tax=Campylobacter ureolyticus TaxID=827 RepID=UPI003F693491